MKNKAKCKLCGDIIESYHAQDYVECSCGEIAVYGGASLECAARSWDNFRRVDDEGNEIVPDVKPLDMKPIEKREDLLKALDDMIASYDRLPPYALGEPCTNADLVSALILIRQIFLS